MYCVDIDYELNCHTKDENGMFISEKINIEGYRAIVLSLVAVLDKSMDEVADILHFEVIEENHIEEKMIRAAEILDEEGNIAYTILEIRTGFGLPD